MYLIYSFEIAFQEKLKVAKLRENTFRMFCRVIFEIFWTFL